MRAPRPTRIITKLRKKGHKDLTKEECCKLLAWQLEQIYAWEQLVWDKIWGGGGGSAPPPPPKWPPK